MYKYNINMHRRMSHGRTFILCSASENAHIKLDLKTITLPTIRHFDF